MRCIATTYADGKSKNQILEIEFEHCSVAADKSQPQRARLADARVRQQLGVFLTGAGNP
jgi:hypothetical protein